MIKSCSTYKNGVSKVRTGSAKNRDFGSLQKWFELTNFNLICLRQTTQHEKLFYLSQ